MISRVRIENFALVREVELELPQRGFIALTGETGAGKTLLMEAIAFAAGTRPNRSMVGPHAERCRVELTIHTGEGELVVLRELSRAGRSRQWIDGKPARVADLVHRIGELIDYSGHTESQRLFNVHYHLQLLDALGDRQHQARVAGLGKLRQSYREVQQALAELAQSEEERERERERLEEEVEELSAATVEAGELEKLLNERRLLIHAEELAGLIREAQQNLSQEDGQGASELLAQAAEQIERIGELLGDSDEVSLELEAYQGQIKQAAAVAADAALFLSSLAERFVPDPARLEEVEGRINLIYRLEQKYRTPANELSKLLEEKRRRLEVISQSSDPSKLTEELGQLEIEINQLLEKVRRTRRSLAARLEQEIEETLVRLSCPGASFMVEIEEVDNPLSRDDRVEFLLSLNPGEIARPLVEIASGGEASRVLLALKRVLASTSRLRLLMFDEIDAGVGGETAHRVGEILGELARRHQVMAITHFAQVAAAASHHILVEKKTDPQTTHIAYRLLSTEERVKEIARLLGDQEGERAQRLAEELLSRHHGAQTPAEG